jgi:hypothetical protein
MMLVWFGFGLFEIGGGRGVLHRFFREWFFAGHPLAPQVAELGD